MEALGINPVLLTAQLISFLVVMAVLNKFLYKKVRKALEERREMVVLAIKQKETVDKKLSEIEQEGEEMRKSNQAELKTILAQARSLVEQTKQEAMAETELRAKKIIEQARVQIEQEKLKAQEDLKIRATLLAREMVQKVMTVQKKNKRFQKLQIDKSIEEFKSLKS